MWGVARKVPIGGRLLSVGGSVRSRKRTSANDVTIAHLPLEIRINFSGAILVFRVYVSKKSLPQQKISKKVSFS